MIIYYYFCGMATFQIIHHKVLDSTNQEAFRHVASAQEGTVWSAGFQTKGKGQYDRVWESQDGNNILATLLLRPTFLPANEQFYISKCTALGICSFLETYQLKTRIKWPNDIYIGPNKICGILIEHQLSGNNLVASIIGFGININQTSFGLAPNPTSLKLETHDTYNALQLLPLVIEQIQKWYQLLQAGEVGHIDSQYDYRLIKDMPQK